MRMKHGSDRGPTTLAKPRLLAAFTAVAMMFATAVPALLPKTAQAAEDTGSVCAPKNVSMGDGTTNVSTDTGVATWVGRNMYVGDPNGQTQFGTSAAPTPSYAVEAEGTTLVKGKLAINSTKASWNQKGFRFGIVGFGAQFRPVSGSDALVVGGSGDSGITLTDASGKKANVLGWGQLGRGWIGETQEDERNYNAQIAGSSSLAMAPTASTSIYVKYDQRLGSEPPYIHAWFEDGASLTDFNGRPRMKRITSEWVGYTFPNTENKPIKFSIGDRGSYYPQDPSNAAQEFRANGAGAWTVYPTRIAYATVVAGTLSDVTPSVTELQSLYSVKSNSAVNWNQNDPLANVHLKGANGDTSDYSNYTSKLENDSGQLSRLASTATENTPNVETIQSGTVIRQKFDKLMDPIKINFSPDNKEKKIVFTGDGKSEMQVFNLPASMLSDGNTNGVSFAFKNIPVVGKDDKNKDVYASVVVNVVDSEGKPFNGAINFHSGWHFYWNTDDDISDGYVKNSQNADKYNAAARSIMWNFADATKVTIRGGQIKQGAAKWNNGDEVTVRSSEPNKSGYITSDDPAAAMLGSILVPKGTFDDHVTTNGRVWVGEDFMMNSPYALKETGASSINKDSEGYWLGQESIRTASIVDMDMERHNFPWGGTVNTACSAIAWNKVNQSEQALGGTGWGIYKTADAAAQHATTTAAGLIRYVTDDDMNIDQASDTPGRIVVNNLNPNSNYYIRELDTHDTQYQVNPYIYRITAGASENDAPDNNPYEQIDAVYQDVDGKAQPLGANDDDQLTQTDAIINKSSGFDIEWGKTERGKTEGLEGSEWILSQGDHRWVIRDDSTPIESITIQKDGQAVNTLKGPQGSTIKGLKAVINPAEANRKVIWSVVPEGSADVIQETDGTTSVVLRTRPESGQITVTATAADGKYASVAITVEESIVVAPSTASIEVETTQRFTATYQGNHISPSDLTWSVKDDKVASINSEGVVTGVGAGTTDVYANYNGMQGIATITVTAPTSTTIYALVPSGWTPMLYTWYGPKNSETKPNGDWPGKGMTYVGDQNGQKLYSATVPTTHEFYFIISNNGNEKDKTNDSELIPAGGGTYDVTDVRNGKVPKAVKRTSNNNGSNGDGSGRNNAAPRRKMASKALSGTSADAREAAWTPVDTTGWTIDNDKAKEDDNPATGKFKVSGLKPGTYYLQENKAPDGYFVNPAKFKIVIAENGTVTWTKSVDGGEIWTAFDPTNGLHWIEDVPTEFSWDKIDAGYFEGDPNATKNPIADSKWKLQKFQNGNYVDEGSEITDCVANAASGCTGTDKNHEAGKFKLTGLALGKYRLYESEAPEGYQKPNDVYYYFELSTKKPGDTTPVKWTKGTGEIDSTTCAPKNATKTASDTNSGGSVQNPTAPNYRQTGSVNWSKVDAEDTDRLLGGSEWTIKFKAEGTSQYGAEYTIVDCTSGGCAVPSGATQPGWTYDRDPAVGKFKLENLQWGDYEFHESKAPDGYNLSTETYTFTVSKNNVNSNIAITGTGVNGNKILNEPGFELPSTGGEGNTLIVLFGVALIAISMLGCAIAMRKRI